MWKDRKMLSIIFVIFVTPIIINVIMSIPTTWAKGDVGDWISFYGSYIGALLGALVAFQVARIQIKAQEDVNKRQKVVNQLPYLVMLKIEIESAIKFLETLSTLANSNQFDFIVNSNFSNPTEINNEYWSGLGYINDSTLIEDLINFKKCYSQLCKTIRENLGILSSESGSIEKQMKKLNSMNKRTNEQEEKLKQLMNQMTYLQGLIESTHSNKEYEWKKIMDNTYLSFAKTILNRINPLIKQIEELKK